MTADNLLRAPRHGSRPLDRSYLVPQPTTTSSTSWVAELVDHEIALVDDSFPARPPLEELCPGTRPRCTCTTFGMCPAQPLRTPRRSEFTVSGVEGCGGVARARTAGYDGCKARP